ncbi:MAG: hypothetical protein HFG28_02190 [Eubacterium sp.]|nr:hypothetical protein [Eubacterium sp.]
MKNINRLINKIVWCVNIMLFFLVCCKITPIPNPIVFYDNGIIKYLVVFVNLIICVFVKNYQDKEDKTFTKRGKVFNCVLCAIYIGINSINTNSNLITNAFIFFVCAFIYCFSLKVIYKLVNVRQIIYITAVCLFGILIIYIGQYTFSVKECGLAEKYEFDEAAFYKKYKNLHENKPFDSYVVVEYSDNAVFVRDLLGETMNFFTFETKKECEQFIKENTLGKEVYAPVLNYQCSFNDDEISITYKPTFKQSDVIVKMQEKNSYGFIFVLIWIVMVSLVGDAYEKIKNSSN